MLQTSIEIHLGQNIPLPVPIEMLSAVQHLEVVHPEEGPAAFQVRFRFGRVGMAALLEHPFLLDPRLAIHSRVILVVRVGPKVRVLINGFITARELKPGPRPGEDLLTISGEDLTFLLDRTAYRQVCYGEDSATIVNRLLSKYAAFGIVPEVSPSQIQVAAGPSENSRAFQGTDLEIIQTLARENGYIFYLKQGLKECRAYWGPAERQGSPQGLLTHGMGAANVEGLSFMMDGDVPMQIEDVVPENESGQGQLTAPSLNATPVLGAIPIASSLPLLRQQLLGVSGRFSQVVALKMAQARVDRSAQQALKVKGHLDTNRYGDILETRRPITLRGTGWTHNGDWSVSRVTHSLEQGKYSQSFELTRGGLGASLS